MSFTIKYDGDSTHVLAAAFSALDDGYDWYVKVAHWVEDPGHPDGGRREKISGRVKAVAVTDDVATTTVTIQPTDDDALATIGDPVTLKIDNVTELVIP